MFTETGISSDYPHESKFACVCMSPYSGNRNLRILILKIEGRNIAEDIHVQSNKQNGKYHYPVTESMNSICFPNIDGLKNTF